MGVKTVCFSWVAVGAMACCGAALAGPVDDLRVDFAKAVYSGSPEHVHQRHPQPLLRAVVVLNVKLDEGDHWQAEVVRTNEEQPEMLARAIETVARAPVVPMPDEVKDHMRRNGFMEAWLFDNDGRFQVKTLAKAQLTGR